MAVALVKSNSASGSLFDGDGIAEISWASGTSAIDNLIVLGLFVGAARTVSSVVDEDTNNYSVVNGGTTALGSGTITSALYYLRPGTAVSTITVTINSATAAPAVLAIAEFSDIQASPLGTHTSNVVGTPGTSHDTGSVTTDQDNCVVVGMSANIDTAAYTGDADFATAIVNDQYMIMAHKLSPSMGAISMTVTSVGSMDSINRIGWFKGNVAGGGGTAHFQTTRRLMLGIS